MTREEAVKEIEKAFEPAFANYIITALTEGATDLGVDCISRQAVIDMTGLSEWFDSSDSYNEFVIALSELPSVTPQEPSWIPVTERLPEEGYRVLAMRITDENYKYMRVATYQGDCWMDDTDKFNKPNPHKVIAWMPLPEPYKGGGKNE